MLELGARELYLDALRPPAGHRLDQAIATTYSLDLICALMAPIAMTKFIALADEEPCENWLTGLDALRRTSDRWMVFCQQGKIAIPGRDLSLFRYLEGAIHEVNAPGGGVFHPKLWVLRFESEEGDPHYRVLCLSRNLTFDRSLDTILVLDQHSRRRRIREETAPLGDFIQALPGMCTSPLTADQADRVERIAREIRRVRFHSPDGFRSRVRMWPFGLDGLSQRPNLADADRLLVVSPFVTAGGLRKLLSRGADNTVISREDQLDAIRDHDFSEMRRLAEWYVTRDEVVSEDLDDDGSHLAAGDDELHLSGLHAKLYAAEFGNVTRVLIGSANATGPAWDGTNVEFMVELDAHLHDVCIDAVLGPDPDEDGQRLAASELGLRALMTPYVRPDRPPPCLGVERRLEMQLRDARSFLLDAGLRAKASQAGEEFQLLLEAKRRPRGQWPSGVKARCWPVSLAEGAGRDVEALANGEAICFSPLSLVALTGMIGFELAAEHGDTRMADRFVLNLPTTGIPSARDRKVLADIIEKSGGFIRYLLMLLADETDPYDIVPLSGDDGKPGEGGRERGIGSLPLFEELVRTLSRDPAKITDIDRLVQDLLSDEESKKAIPEGFMDTWPMFIEVMEEIERRE